MLELNVDAIRDYDSDGRETTFPNVRKGQCPSGKKCSECIRSDVPDLLLHVPGDLYIIGKSQRTRIYFHGKRLGRNCFC